MSKGRTQRFERILGNLSFDTEDGEAWWGRGGSHASGRRLGVVVECFGDSREGEGRGELDISSVPSNPAFPLPRPTYRAHLIPLVWTLNPHR